MLKAVKMRLEYGMGPEFEKAHAEVWPEIEALIHEYGGRQCSVFLDERTGYLFACVTVEDEEKWEAIRDNVLLRKWFDHISCTVKTDRENRPVVEPLRLVFHVD